MNNQLATDFSQLSHKKCVPCEGGTSPFSTQEEELYLTAVAGWKIDRQSIHRLEKTIVCKNFKNGVALINQIADIAETEGHHPNLHLVNYKELQVELYTHALGGLSVNDFILAAKINELLSEHTV